MSKKLDRSRDQELEDEKKQNLFLGDKKMFKNVNQNLQHNRNYEIINLKNSSSEKNDDKEEYSESDEYFEEEDEEGDELEDDEDEDDEINSEFQNVKKKKIEQPPQIWSRKKSGMMDVDDIDSVSADIIINKPEDSNDKNKNEEINKEKITNINTECTTQNNYKKANFFTTPIDISKKANNSNYFNVNNGLKDNQNNKSINNSNINKDNNINNILNNSSNFKIESNSNNNDNLNKNININNINNNDNKSNYNIPAPKTNNIPNQLNQQQQQYKEKIIIPLMFNSYRLIPLINEKISRYRIKNIPGNILFFIQEKLKAYLRIYLLRLIKISRIRNVNFNLYSNNPNGQIHYKFKTYNWVVSKDNEKQKQENIIISPAKEFDILFTSNYKKKFDLIEEYVELNNKKIKFEKISSCKEKYEENNKTKGIESTIKITDGPNPTIKLLPGRRTKKKNNTFFKEMRKKFVQTKKKEDLNIQKSFTKNTLDTFLNDTSTYKNQSFSNNPNLIDGGNNNCLDMSSRISDTMSHNNLSYTNNNCFNNTAQNEINMNVFTYFDPTKDGAIYGRQKKRINLKDFIFLLENSNEYIPNKIYLLNKASIDNTKNK